MKLSIDVAKVFHFAVHSCGIRFLYCYTAVGKHKGMDNSMLVDFPTVLMQWSPSISRARPERATEKEAKRSTGLSGSYDFQVRRVSADELPGVERKSENSRRIPGVRPMEKGG
jgi:hypothetical protein